MAKRKRKKSKSFGTKTNSGRIKPLSHNQSVEMTNKRESSRFSPKVPGRSESQPKGCDDGRGSIRSGTANNRPKQVTPISTYNYKSEYARYQKSLSLLPAFTIAGVDFYPTTDYCGYNVVIPPDWNVDEADLLPQDFWDLAPPEFYQDPGPLDPTVIPPENFPPFGCTDPNALNYDPDAETDDGSCEYDNPVEGCTDPEAINYNPDANINDGSCKYPADEPEPDGDIPECQLTEACIWKSAATVEEAETACPAGTTNKGFVDLGALGDGSLKVLCCGPQPSPEQILWYRYPGEDWQPISSANGDLSVSCEPEPDVGEEYGDLQDNTQYCGTITTGTNSESAGPILIVPANNVIGPITSVTGTGSNPMQLFINGVSFGFYNNRSAPVQEFNLARCDGNPPETVPNVTGDFIFKAVDANGTVFSRKESECPETSYTCGKPPS